MSQNKIFTRSQGSKPGTSGSSNAGQNNNKRNGKGDKAHSDVANYEGQLVNHPVTIGKILTKAKFTNYKEITKLGRLERAFPACTSATKGGQKHCCGRQGVRVRDWVGNAGGGGASEHLDSVISLRTNKGTGDFQSNNNVHNLTSHFIANPLWFNFTVSITCPFCGLDIKTTLLTCSGFPGMHEGKSAYQNGWNSQIHNIF